MAEVTRESDLPESEKMQADRVSQLGRLLGAREKVKVGEEQIDQGYGSQDFDTEPIYEWKYIHSEKERRVARKQLGAIYRMTTYDSVKDQIAEELKTSRTALDHPAIFGIQKVTFGTVGLALVLAFGAAIVWGVWIGIQFLFSALP